MKRNIRKHIKTACRLWLLFLLSISSGLYGQFAPNRRSLMQFGLNNITNIMQTHHSNTLDIMQDSRDYFNAITVRQISPFNTAALLQFHGDNPGGQTVFAEQSGDGANFIFQQQGHETEADGGWNNFIWARQYGEGNISSQSQRFFSQISTVSQAGEGNQSEQIQQAEDKAEANVQQQGSENRALQRQNGHDEVNFSITAPKGGGGISKNNSDALVFNHAEYFRLYAELIQEGNDNFSVQDQYGMSGVVISIDNVNEQAIIQVEYIGQKSLSYQTGSEHQAAQVQSGLNHFSAAMTGNIQKIALRQIGHQSSINQTGSSHSALQEQSGINRLNINITALASKEQIELAGIGHHASSEQSGSFNESSQMQTGMDDLSISRTMLSGLTAITEIGHRAEAVQSGNNNVLIQEQEMIKDAKISASFSAHGNDAGLLYKTFGTAFNRIGHIAEADQHGDFNEASQFQSGVTELSVVYEAGRTGHAAFIMQTGAQHMGEQKQSGYNQYSELLQEGLENRAFQHQAGTGHYSAVEQLIGSQHAEIFQAGAGHRANVYQGVGMQNTAYIRQYN